MDPKWCRSSEETQHVLLFILRCVRVVMEAESRAGLSAGKREKTTDKG